MKKWIVAFMLFFASAGYADDGVLGYWTTIDDETKEAKSIVRIYEYQGKVYGRVVELLKNKQARAKLPDSPLIEGLDIIWDLEKKGDRYAAGEILDPKKGKVYGCEMWREGDDLIVRGKIAFLGRNQTWKNAADFKPKNDDAFIPQKPKLK